jgi:hypothetical protein
MFKKVALVVCCCAFLFLAISARADVMDPTLSMGDPNCASSAIQPTIPVTGVFFLAPVNGGGVFALCNASGTLWTQFDVVVPISTGINQNTVVCNVTGTPAPFGGCTVSTIGNFVDIFFSPNNSTCSGNNCGIPNDFFLLVDFNNPCPAESVECTPSGDWPAGSLLTFNPNGTQGSAIAFAPVPEPASLLLLATGVLAILFFWRRRSNV